VEQGVSIGLSSACCSFRKQREWVARTPSLVENFYLDHRQDERLPSRPGSLSRSPRPNRRGIFEKEDTMTKVKFRKSVQRALLLCLLCAASAISSPAQTFTSLASFNGTNGASPEGILVQGVDGNYYGTTYGGGASGDGTVFKITAAGTLTTLHSFNGTDGKEPQGGLVLATDGNLYGTTTYGGTYGYGTVFKITPAGALTSLYSFCGTASCSGLEYPYAGLVLDYFGNLYGTTFFGGEAGGVFRITTGGSLTVLFTFDSTNGSNPTSPLALDSVLGIYGTTLDGGASGKGTAFRLSGELLTTLASFDGTDGENPWGGWQTPTGTGHPCTGQLSVVVPAIATAAVARSS